MLKIGTVGTSWITAKWIDAVKTLQNADVVAVHSRDPEKGKRFAEECHVAHVCTTLDEMLPLVDAVYIASPNSLHAEQSMFFLHHGKHVICEKPLASNYREGLQVVNLANEKGLFLAEAYKTACMPAYQAVIRTLPRLGEIRHVFFPFSKYSSRYDAHKRGENVNTFRAEFSNGALLDLGIYCIHPMLDWFGYPKNIKAMGTIVPGGADGVGAALCEYGGFTAVLHYGKVSDSMIPCEIQGEAGTLVFRNISIPTDLVFYPRNGTPEPIPTETLPNDMIYEAKAFTEAILRGDTECVAVPNSRSLDALSVMDTIRSQICLKFPADAD